MSRNAIKYVKATIVAASPIKLSSGLDQMSDADVMVDAAGTPFIPGTSFAGVMRHYACSLQKQGTLGDDGFVNRWFGYIKKYVDEGGQSLVRVHDAFAASGATVSTRDGVRLSANKTAIPQGKFDYQVVDAGVEFGLRMEFCYDPQTQKKEAEALLSALLRGICAGEIMVGGKTSRGFGKLDVHDVLVLDLDLSNVEDVRRYIDFDWEKSEFAPYGDKSGEEESASLFEEPVVVNLKVVSSLMIRDYATVERSGYEQKLVDAQTLEGPDGCPIVPGTTWAGAFRHHMERILDNSGYDVRVGRDGAAKEFLSRVFGNVDGGRGIASKIEFGESKLIGSSTINLTRTAIDRFTGGAADEKLFTNRLAFGGTTTLSVRWRKDIDEADKMLLASLVNVCVDDLCDGTLAVGGMTATGLGMFRRVPENDGEVAA